MSTIALDHKSKATIIQGPRGSGKSTLAKMISNRSRCTDGFITGYCGPIHVKGEQFFGRSRFCLFPINSRAVIVNDVQLTIDNLHQIKEHTKSLHFVAERKGFDPVKIATPHFIYIFDCDVASTYHNFNQMENVQVLTLGGD